jgi:uncharacterized repeat protein (TIGR02543 family)
MQLIQKLKQGLKAATAVALSACMTLGAATPALAADDSSDEIVGNLSIVSMFDPEKSSVIDGHAFVVFTSYKDGLGLNFTDLYGYYEETDEFKAAVETDNSELSWRSQFRECADGLGLNDLTLDEYTQTPEDDRESESFQYKSLYDAIIQYGDASFTGSKDGGTPYSQYKKTSYNCTLDSGEYITIGNYTFSGKEELAMSAISNSTAYNDVKTIVSDGIKEGVTVDEVLQGVSGLLLKYINGEIASYDELVEQLKAYAASVLTTDGCNAFLDLLSVKDNRTKLLDGDAKGGLFVDRELWRQKVYQTLSPNKVYSVDITQSQLDRLMVCANSGNENHYSVLTHNCSGAAANLWNAAVGSDADGNKTDLYLDAMDKTYEMLDNLATTPKRIREVLDTWEGSYEMDLIQGVKVPTYEVAFDSNGGTEVTAQTVQVGKLASEPAAPTRGGYTFAGWLLDGEKYDFSAPVTGGITLVASWTKNAEPEPVEPGGTTPEPKGTTPEPKGTDAGSQPEVKSASTAVSKSAGSVPKTGESNVAAAVVPMAALGVASILVARRRLS